MESLLCDEVLWISTYSNPPSSLEETFDQKSRSNKCIDEAYHMTKEDCEQALKICLENDKNYAPKPHYLQYLISNNLVNARSKIIQWFIKSQIQLNIASFETIFYAANYFDRFVSLNLCKEWKEWMVELLAIACLSIASKFGDATADSAPTLHEINQSIVHDVVEYHYVFETSTIAEMEMVLIKALDWRLNCTTLQSYVEMFKRLMDCDLYHQTHDIHNRLNDFLLRALSDIKMLEFRPSVVALSALWCCSDNSTIISRIPNYASLQTFYSQDQKDDLARCHEMMINSSNTTSLYSCVTQYNSPSSPTTVLMLKKHVSICDIRVDLSLFRI